MSVDTRHKETSGEGGIRVRVNWAKHTETELLLEPSHRHGHRNRMNGWLFASSRHPYGRLFSGCGDEHFTLNNTVLPVTWLSDMQIPVQIIKSFT